MLIKHISSGYSFYREKGRAVIEFQEVRYPKKTYELEPITRETT